MAFLAAVGKFLAREVIQRLGEDALAEGRRIFAEETAKGTPKKEAARLAADHMMRHTAGRGLGAVRAAGRAAARRSASLLRKKGGGR